VQGVIDDNVGVKRMLSISRRRRKFCLDLQRVIQLASHHRFFLSSGALDRC
jgi:hypothetical protein